MGFAIEIVQGNIVGEDVDAIVNAANSTLLGGGGVDGAIHAAGGPQILAECRKIREECGECPPGQAVLTGGGRLKARHVIHTVGPIWEGGTKDEPQILRDCYHRCLEIARSHRFESVSFPAISCGAYGFPLKPAAEIALSTAHSFSNAESAIRTVRFVLFGATIYNVFQEASDRLRSESP